MTTYYCDLTEDFVDRNGTDSTTNVLTGPGGFRAALTGSGAATALAAGDTLLAYGEARTDRWVELTCGKDVSGWTIGATVADNNGGAEWHGKLCEVNVGADNTHIYVQLDSGYVYGDITTGSGINNTTDTDTTTLSAKGAPGMKLDSLGGDTTGGGIYILGVNSSYVEDGTRATFNGNSVATYGLFTGVNIYYLTLRNLRCTGAGSHGMTWPSLTGQSSHWVFQNCAFDANGGDGVSMVDCVNVLFERCAFINNTARGIYTNTVILRCCVIIGNGGVGWQGDFTSIIKCLIHDNTGDSLMPSSGMSIIEDCVIDGTDGGEDGINMASAPDIHVRNCRITNHSVVGKYGIVSSHSSSSSQTEDYNVFHNNQAGDVHSALTTGSNSYGDGANHISDPADDGMTDVGSDDFNVKAGALLRSTEIDLMALVP